MNIRKTKYPIKLAPAMAIIFLSLAACAPEVKTIGVSLWGTNVGYEMSFKGFKAGLAKNGFEEGKNIRFITDNPYGDKKKQKEIIESFIAQGADLLFTMTTPGTLVAKETTDKVPIVFAVVTYPAESGIIDSLESSKNNLVGTRNYVPPSQQFFVFERIFPDTKTMAFVYRKDEPNSINQLKELKAVFDERKIALVEIAAVDLEGIRKQLAENIERVDSVYSACDTLTGNGGEEIINELALQYKKPNFACNREGVLKGALIGNVGNFEALGAISGEKAAQILKGTDPAWLQTESPRENHIIINTKRAADIGITVPKDLLDSAREIITE